MSTKRLIRAAAAALVTSALPALTASAQDASGQAGKKRPPNIIYIISDDQGWKDVGYHGSDIKTPNIDALAAGGARLEQFYAQPLLLETEFKAMKQRLKLPPALPNDEVIYGGEGVD